MMKILRQKMSALLVMLAIMTSVVSWGQAYTLNHGFGGPTGVPTGIQVVSYDGATSCSTASNGANAVTTLVLKAAPGYNFTITSVNGIGVRSNAGPNMFTLQVVNNGTASGPVTDVINSSSCAGNTALNALNVPAANQAITENNSVSIKVTRYPNGPTGGGYSHVKSLTIQGVVSLAVPPAPVATVATTLTSVGFTANWNAVTGATGYRLDVATDMAFTQILENYDNFAVPGTSQFVSMGIEPNTTYYYRVRAERDATTSPNSNVITIATPQAFPATLTTIAILATDITTTGGISGGTITADGGAPVTARGVVWATTANPVIAGLNTTNGTGTGTFTSSLTGLSPNTQYYYRAYATNVVDTAYGNEFSFYTLANTPEAPTASNAGIFSLDIALAVNGNPANTLYAIRINGGEYTNGYLDLSGSVSTIPVWHTAAEWAAVSAAALEPATTYTFDIAAQNGAGVQTPWSTTGQGTTLPLAGPTALMLLDNDLEFEPVCLNTAADGLAGSFVFEGVNLNGSGMGLGTVSISGPDGAMLDGISFSESADSGYEEGALQVEDIEEGEDRTIYVRFDPQAGVSYGTLHIELALTDTYNESAAPLALNVVIVDLPTAGAQTLCAGSTVANLTATSGTGIKWYASQTGGTALAATAVLATGTYYASQSIGDCESERIAVAVTVTPLPTAPVAAAQLFCDAGTVSQLIATGIAEPVDTTMTEDFESAAIGAISGAVTLATGEWNFTGPLLGIDTGTIYPSPSPNGHELQLYGNAMAVSPEFDSVGSVSLIVRSTTTNGALNIYKIVNGTETLLATHLNNDLFGGTDPVTLTIPVNAENVKLKFHNAGGTSYLAMDNIAMTTTDAPAVNWYDVATGGTPLAGTAALATGTYYVTQTMNDCESPRTAVAVTVNPIPDAPIAAAQAFCGPATTGGLVVTTGTAPKWYTAETGGTALDITTALATGTYYVSQTVNGCESARTAVAVTVNPIPAAPTVVAVQTFCNTATVADLDADGVNVLWYTTATGGTALEETAAITAGTSLYYASQTINGCESAIRSAVAVQLNMTAAPVAAAQSFCGTGTVSQLMATGTAVQWYAAETGGTALAGTAALATGNYYVSQTINGCESARTMVAVTVNPIPAAPGTAPLTFCNSATVSELTATTGTGLQWYSAVTGGTSLAGTTLLATGTYYASQTVNGCESARTAVLVTVNVTPVPTAAAQSFCNAGTVADLEVTATAPKWYAAQTGGTQLEGTAALATGTYYVSQTLNGCEGPRVSVAVTVTETVIPTGDAEQDFEAGETLADLEVEGDNIVWYGEETLETILPDTTALVDGTTYYAVAMSGECMSESSIAITVNEVLSTIGFDRDSLSYYPNPVNDMLNLSYRNTIKSVVVYNLLGQPVVSKDVNAATVQLDMSALAAGSYIMKVVSGESTATIKVIKR